jgi:D-beta-D-heptose 7-phosphate kinase/D-beta-D-heptose 1-phosphate adenosyltransferase
MLEDKIKTLSQLIRLTKTLKDKGRTVVFTNGCFDIMHKGHVKLLEKAKSLGDVLIVAVNSDSSVKRIKGPKRPINRQADRAAVIAGLHSVDFVAFFNDPTPEALIRAIKPDILVKGGDWKNGNIAGGDFVKSLGGKVYSVKYMKGYSTSRLIENILTRFNNRGKCRRMTYSAAQN